MQKINFQALGCVRIRDVLYDLNLFGYCERQSKNLMVPNGHNNNQILIGHKYIK